MTSPQVRAELLRSLFQQAPVAIASGVVVPIALLAIYWDAFPRQQLLGWYALMCLIAGGRLALLLAYRRAAPAMERIALWGRLYVLGTLISGIAWGSAGVLMFLPENLEYQFFLPFVLAGMCTGAVTSLGAHLPAFYAFVVPVMAPYLAMCLHRGDTVHVAVAFVVAFYLAALAFFARNYQHSIAESWRLHFENLRLMEQLAARKEEAERANVAKSRFLAAASHDLRQPLHAMALFISALKDKNRDAEVGAIVDRLAKSVESLEDLFHALLDISRLDAGTVRPELHTFPVQSLLDGIAGDFAAEAAEKDLRFRVVPCRAFVTSDRLLLDRIVRNLVANAIRYTQTGGVVIGCRRRRASVRIDIGDTGVGIASAHLPDIFQEFYQIDNPARDRSRGLGLGLAIVDRLSRLLNHAVSVRSIPGRGSVFSIEVPLGSAAQQRAETMREQPTPGTDLAGALVVVIDDERAVLDGMGDALGEWGARALLAESLEEARGLLAQAAERPAAIVSDYRLRDRENGIDAIKALQASHGGAIPGILVTGDTAPEHLRAAASSGFHVLHKPIRPAQLHALLRFVVKT